ncbi:hypothetical protein ACUXV3_07450 [Roseobacteraceae bacterium NS-SX3]
MRDETEGLTPASPQRKLTPANENPWYVLMTLYGEQEGDEIDVELHENNRRAWNSWVLMSHTLQKIQEYTVGWKGELLNELNSLTWGANEEILFAEAIQKRAAKSKKFRPRWNDCIHFWSFEFESNLCLDGFILPEDIEFARCKLLSISARSAVFLGDLRLEGTYVTLGVTFCDALFCAEYQSFDTEYHGPANFLRSIFRSEMYCCYNTFYSEAYFQSVRFCGDAEFIGSVFLYDGEGHDDEGFFQGCIFESVTSFRDVRFLRQYPKFHESLLHEKTTFSAKRECWPDWASQSLHHARSACATIRHLLAKQGLPEDEHFFFRREMHFAGRIGTIWQRLPYLLFGLFSEYGYSILRPTLWLLGVWALGFAAFWGYLSGCCVPAPDGLIERPMGSAMALSFSNLFPLFGFGRVYFSAEFMMKLPAALKTLAGFQTVASLPLLFFLGLGLRQRFRLR